MTISYKKLWIMCAEKEMSKAELRRWVMGGTLEEAQEAIEEINASEENTSAIDRLLSGGGPVGGDG